MVTVEEIEAALAKATPGPWDVQPNYEWVDNEEGTTGPILSWDVYGSDSKLIVDEMEHKFNAALITSAPTYLRWLLDENARLRGEACHRSRGGDRLPAPSGISGCGLRRGASSSFGVGAAARMLPELSEGRRRTRARRSA